MHMATKKASAEFILEQLGHPDRFSVRSMFGEFALYADGKPVAFICDDQLFVKIMDESAVLERRCERAPAYTGSKDYYLVPEDVDHRRSQAAGNAAAHEQRFAVAEEPEESRAEVTSEPALSAGTGLSHPLCAAPSDRLEARPRARPAHAGCCHR